MDDVTIEWKRFGEAFVADLWHFYDSDEFSDVTIITANNNEIKSHRILLAMCSTYFRELFQRNKNNQMGHIVCLPHLRSDIVQKIFAMIYSGFTQVSPVDVQAFVKSAKFLKLHGFEGIEIDTFGDIGPQGDRTFSLRLRRLDEQPTNGMTPGMNQMVSSTAELTVKPDEMNTANGTDVGANTINGTTDDKFFPSDDSSDDGDIFDRSPSKENEDTDMD